jgi:hypothetical protein
MLDRLIDVGLQFIQLGQCWHYIDQFEKAVVLRRGLYHRTFEPGWRGCWPLAFEKVITVNVKPEPMYLDPQSVHTQDDYLVNVQVGLEYKVICPKTFLLDYENTEDTIAMLISGCVADAIQQAKWCDLRSGVWCKGLKVRANRIARKRGAHIDNLIIQDLASGAANRLWIEGVEL